MTSAQSRPLFRHQLVSSNGGGVHDKSSIQGIIPYYIGVALRFLNDVKPTNTFEAYFTDMINFNRRVD